VSDERLLRSAARGDAPSLETFIRHHAPDVYRFLVGMLGDELEAGDAMQETFVRVARSVGRYQSDEDPVSWLFAIARRVSTDVRPTPSAAPLPMRDGEDSGAWARRALRALPAEHRGVLVARDVMGWTDERIAAVLAIDPTDVPMRVTQAREAMLVQETV
jgi:RNA polymerase sigma-70 factor (ECF subfamily)